MIQVQEGAAEEAQTEPKAALPAYGGRHSATRLALAFPERQIAGGTGAVDAIVHPIRLPSHAAV
jgi:hypothetical protein